MDVPSLVLNMSVIQMRHCAVWTARRHAFALRSLLVCVCSAFCLQFRGRRINRLDYLCILRCISWTSRQRTVETIHTDAKRMRTQGRKIFWSLQTPFSVVALLLRVERLIWSLWCLCVSTFGWLVG